MVADRVPCVATPVETTQAYLRTKREKMGHSLHHQGLALDEEMLRDEEERDARDGKGAQDGDG